MRYVGSKNKLSKDLIPIIQSYITSDTKGYIEPFVGGGNMIDKIQCSNKIGCDIHEELIELLKYAQEFSSLIPERILKEEIGRKGYVRVILSKDGKGKKFLVHRLVAIHFIPNPNDLPEVNHKDGIKTHN